MLRTYRNLVTAFVLMMGLLYLAANHRSTSAQSDSERSLGVRTRSVKESPAEIRAYWTADRMAHAKPMPLLSGSTKGKQAQKATKNPKPPLAITTANMCAGGPADIDYPGPIDRPATAVEDTTKYPYCSMGKLFGTQVSVQGTTTTTTDYYCSAAAVSEFVLMTAGHCVFDNGAPIDGIYFVAQYNTPGEQKFTAAKPGWFLQWQNNQDRDFDIALIETNESMTSIGNLALVALDDPILHSCCARAVGYPAEGSFSGETMYEAYGNWTSTDQSHNHPYSIGMEGNNMTPGSSGGPWFAVERTTHLAHVMGVNSYFYASTPPMYSPELRYPIADLWKCVTQGCRP